MTAQATTVLCRNCQGEHSARLIRQGRFVLGEVDCPRAPAPVQLSDDAELFFYLRSLDEVSKEPVLNDQGVAPRAQIYITDACDCSCPVCYASSGPRAQPAHLPVPEIVRRASEAKKRGTKLILLIGGEPTEHPGLLEAVGQIHALGLKATLVSQGDKLGRDPTLARRLAKAGLRHVSLQLDSLQPATLKRLRGRADLEIKQAAIANVVAAGIPYSLTTTVSTANLSEVGELVRWAARLPVMPSLMLFQSMVRYGRYPSDLYGVSREAVIRTLLDDAAVEGASQEHLHVVPRLPPQLQAIHPDCGTLLFGLRRQGRLVPVECAFDVAGFCRALVRDFGMNRTWLGWLLEFLRHMKPGYRWELAKALMDLRPGKANRRLLMIGFTSFCEPEFMDVQRLRRCGNHVLLASGAAPVCSHFGTQPRTTPSDLRTSP